MSLPVPDLIGLKRRLTTTSKGLRNVSIGMVVALSFSGLMPVIASADAPLGWQLLPVGTVVDQQSVTLPSGIAAIASGLRVEYVSSNVNNQKVLASGLIMTPDTRPAHPNIVTWSHALTGVADQCAPSVDSTDYFYPEAQAAVEAYLEQGWTVSAPDFAGLGTPGTYQAFVGNTEARSVIDSVRAARHLDHSLTRDWVAAGHSGGGSSPLFAGEIANSYGVGLHMKGVVSLAPASNLDSILPFAPGTPLNGYIPITLYGIAQADPSSHALQYLAAPARALLPILHTGCVFDILDAYQDLTADQLVTGGTLPTGILTEIAHYDNPAQQPSTVPVYLLQGLDDTEVPPFLTELLQSEECAQGSTSFLQEYPGVGHDDLPIVTTTDQTNYINARFNGDPAPSSC